MTMTDETVPPEVIEEATPLTVVEEEILEEEEWLDTTSAHGRVKARFSGVEYTLRRPKIGAIRSFQEELQDIADEERRKIEDGATRIDSAEAFLGLTRRIWDSTEVNSKKLPADDDLPAWFLNGAIVGQIINYWKSIPPRPGAK